MAIWRPNLQKIVIRLLMYCLWWHHQDYRAFLGEERFGIVPDNPAKESCGGFLSVVSRCAEEASLKLTRSDDIEIRGRKFCNYEIWWFGKNIENLGIYKNWKFTGITRERLSRYFLMAELFWNLCLLDRTIAFFTRPFRSRFLLSPPQLIFFRCKKINLSALFSKSET